MNTLFRKLTKDKKGATAIEYGLICALIVIAAIGAIHALAGTTIGMWADVSSKTHDAMQKSGGS